MAMQDKKLGKSRETFRREFLLFKIIVAILGVVSTVGIIALVAWIASVVGKM